jgi:GxxExxY protein
MRTETASDIVGTASRQEGLIAKELTESIIGAFYDVYNSLGFGLLEKAYVGALVVELASRGRVITREVPTDILYKGVIVATYKMDLVVDDRVVIEAKSTHQLSKADT